MLLTRAFSKSARISAAGPFSARIPFATVRIESLPGGIPRSASFCDPTSAVTVVLRVEGTAEGFKKAPIELNETFEEIWAKGVDPDDYKSPYLYNPEDPHNKLKKEQQDALDAVKSNYDRNKPVPLRIG